MPQVKVFDDLDNTLFSIIEAADRKGRTRFVKPQQYLPRDVSLRSSAALREVLEYSLQPHYLFTSQAKNWLKNIEAEKIEFDNKDWLVSFNAAKLFFLPGVEPAKELAELRRFFEAMVPYFVANADRDGPSVIRIMNERDSHGRVYGSFACIGGGAEPAEFASELQALIDESPVLLHFMRGCGLALGKIGRYSWADMKEEHFFLIGERPWENSFRKKLTEKRAHTEAMRSNATA